MKGLKYWCMVFSIHLALSLVARHLTGWPRQELREVVVMSAIFATNWTLLVYWVSRRVMKKSNDK